MSAYQGQSWSQAFPAQQYNHQQQYYAHQQQQQPEFNQYPQHYVTHQQVYEHPQPQLQRRFNHGPTPTPAPITAQQQQHQQYQSHPSYQSQQAYNNHDYAHMQAVRDQDAQRLAADAARRRSKKPTDKNMPDGVEDCIIGDGVDNYNRLRDMERRLDATIMRKRLDAQSSHDSNVKIFRTLRIWISNTVEDQPWQSDNLDNNTFDFSNTDASYRVRIEGRLLPDELSNEDSDSDSDDEGQAAQQNADAMEENKLNTKQKKMTISEDEKYRFGYFIKALNVEYPKSRTKDESVEWKKPTASPNTNIKDLDYISFKRGGDENINITINLTLDEPVERFILSQDLVEIMDQNVATRAEVVDGVYEYIKLHELQDDEEKRSFRCDESLRRVFGKYTELLPNVPDKLSKHLDPIPPIKLDYTIRTDQKFHDDPKPTIYDVLVSIADPLPALLKEFNLSSNLASSLTEITALNEQVALIIQSIGESKAKHNFLSALAKDPQGFIKQWMSSQGRDLEVIMGEAMRGGAEDANSEEFKRGGENGVWGTQAVKETINLMLATGKSRA